MTTFWQMPPGLSTFLDPWSLSRLSWPSGWLIAVRKISPELQTVQRVNFLHNKQSTATPITISVLNHAAALRYTRRLSLLHFRTSLRPRFCHLSAPTQRLLGKLECPVLLASTCKTCLELSTLLQNVKATIKKDAVTWLKYCVICQL